MTRLIRKQVYITLEQDEALRRLANETGLSQSAIIRIAITNYASGMAVTKRDLAAWEREVEFINQRMAQGPGNGERTWRREELYER